VAAEVEREDRVACLGERAREDAHPSPIRRESVGEHDCGRRSEVFSTRVGIRRRRQIQGCRGAAVQHQIDALRPRGFETRQPQNTQEVRRQSEE